MPRFDGTGPLGKGPMTGRGEGFCVLRSPEQAPIDPKVITDRQDESVGESADAGDDSGTAASDGPSSQGKSVAKAQRAKNSAANMPTDFRPPMCAGYAGLAGRFYVPGATAKTRQAVFSHVHRSTYVAPYGCWVHPLLRRGFGLHLGGGFGRNRLVRRGRLVY